MTAISHNAHPSFEETYPKAPFADLIRLALALADGVVSLRARLAAATQLAAEPAATRAGRF